MSSHAFDGATGPMLLPIEFGLEHPGDEEITADGNHVIVRGHVSAPKHYSCELGTLDW